MSAIIMEIPKKYENLEKLLLDIRDGTKTFYKEKRKFPRVRNGIVAKVADKNELSPIFKVLDISYEGMLLRTTLHLKLEDTIELLLYLPLFPRPVNLRARVVRILGAKAEGEDEAFDVGLEFLPMARQDKEKVIETVDGLKKRQQVV